MSVLFQDSQMFPLSVSGFLVIGLDGAYVLPKDGGKY